MAFRRIVKYPDPSLRKKSSLVKSGDSTIPVLVGDLWDTLNIAQGAGLSAPQIGVHKRVIYISCGGFRTEMINPTITSADGLTGMLEGCLSFPGVSETVSRYENITVKYHDLEDIEHTVDLSGIAAQAVQHEIEHLDGKLMIDHFKPFKRSRIAKVVKKVTGKVDDIMSTPKADEAMPRRVRTNSHLSRKEIKKRKKNRLRSRKK